MLYFIDNKRDLVPAIIQGYETYLKAITGEQKRPHYTNAALTLFI
ncbi:hypothetical protein PE36_12507 [Moritella sp. PE36]|nr:hypothetical protein PE36_12507 [Moritella sp. PE36]